MVEVNDADLEFLRSSNVSPQSSGWIEGRAVQNFGWPYSFAEFVAATDATLTLTTRSGERKKLIVEANGTFRFGPVPPGIYSISAQSPVLGDGRLAQREIRVPQGGCAVANASFSSESTISGKVLNADGKPASKIRLELGEIQPSGTVRLIPETWTNSDQDGTFKISNAPLGRIVLAANLKGAPTEQMPVAKPSSHD